MRVLILGGTTEASILARRIADRRDLQPVLSFAGRTRNPATPPIPSRSGGFGGIDGLNTWLTKHRTDAVIDATHPFAAQMSHHAASACADLAIPLAVLTRPPWHPQGGDRWTRVPTMQAAVQELGSHPRTVFLTIGGLQLANFAQAPQHRYIVRTIDQPNAILPTHRLILARGPFSVDDEIALMRDENIDVLVTKNSGGTATEAKLAAARTQRIEVIMVERPAPEAVQTFTAVDDILEWIERHRPAR